MAKHPNTRELQRIRVTKQILIAVTVATGLLIGVLALHGNFARLQPLAPTQLQQR